MNTIPTEKKRRGRTLAIVGAVVVAAGAGVGIGSQTTTPQSRAVAAPEAVTVTSTVTAPAVTEQVTRTVEVTEQVTPDSCTEAIARAREGFSSAGDIMLAFSRLIDGIYPALQAAMNYDADGIDRFNDTMEQVNADIVEANNDLDPDGFNAAATDCEAGR